MYASSVTAPTRPARPPVLTAYFVQTVGPDHAARFLRDLRRQAAAGRFRLHLVADHGAGPVTEALRDRVERALAGPLAAALDRIAVCAPPPFAADAERLAGRLGVPVRHFVDDWHGAQRWLREPAPPRP